MGAHLSLQAYWQQAAFYLALIIFALLVLNWAIISALADDPKRKAELRKIALSDAIFFAGIPPLFYLLAPFSSDIMNALGTAIAHYKGFVALIVISIGVGLACYLILVDTVLFGKTAEGRYS